MSSGKMLFSLSGTVSQEGLDRLISELRSAGFIGAPIKRGALEFFVGDRFLQLVTFMGCSPFIKLEPDEPSSDDFCRIRIRGPHSTPRFVEGTNTRPPRCPHCRQPVKAWQALAERWRSQTAALHTCPGCGQPVPFEELEWRRNAGVGRLFLEVTHIFPGEAVPVQALLDLLEKQGSPWSYFYIQE